MSQEWTRRRRTTALVALWAAMVAATSLSCEPPTDTPAASSPADVLVGDTGGVGRPGTADSLQPDGSGTRLPDGGSTGTDIATVDTGPGGTKDTGPAGAGAFGQSCQTASDCTSGLCTDSYDGMLCTRPCGDGCPDGWACGSGGDGDPVCLSIHADLCNPCRTNGECAAHAPGARCVARDDEGAFCGTPCDGGCPPGAECTPGNDVNGEAVERCLPTGGAACTCSANAIAEGLSTDCAVTNEVGSCKGVRACKEGGLSTCDAPTPVAEVCGGGDEDCDGSVDEEDADGCVPWFVDKDADGFGVAADARCLCAASGDSVASLQGDCDDANPAVFPGEPCTKASCLGGQLTPDSICEASGACTTPEPASCPGSLACANATSCLGTCASVGDCTGGTWCDGGACAPALAEGSPCTAAVQCATGYCGNGYCCAKGACCQSAADCDDGNVCTTDTCAGAECVHAANTAPCSVPTCSGGAFVGAATCADGACGQAPVTACEGGDPCKVYGCDPLVGCTASNAPAGALCGTASCSGFELTSSQTCDGLGGCTLGGGAEPCPGGLTCLTPTGCRTQCTSTEQCAPSHFCEAGACEEVREDGTECSKDTQCASGHCDGGFCCGEGECCAATEDCDDGNVCTTDTCDQFQCGHAPNTLPCSQPACSGTSWFGAAVCAGGTCGAPPGAECGGDDPCKVFGCDPATGCTVQPAPAGTTCGAPACEGNLLTSATTCDGFGGCTVGAGTEPCPGGTTCLTVTSCRTLCTAPEHCATGFICEANTCTPERDDGEACTKDAQCGSGHCGGGFCCGEGACCASAADCDDGNICTTEACVASQCQHTPNTAPCGAPSCQGSTWLGQAVCSGGICGAPPATSCEGENPCQVYGCDPVAGCTVDDAPQGKVCGAPSCEGNMLSSTQSCNGLGGCTLGAGTEPCPGGLACLTATSCRTQCSAAEHCAPGYFCEATACKPLRDNGEVCTKDLQCTSDHCAGGFCCDSGVCCGADSDCDDGNPCTNDTCDGFQCKTKVVGGECAAAKCVGLTYVSAADCLGGSCGTPVTQSCAGSKACHVYGCDGDAGCTDDLAEPGTVCGPKACEGYILSSEDVCDGAGTCGGGADVAPCAGGFACKDTTSCRTYCTIDAHCQPGLVCLAGQCQAKKAAGASCTGDAECATSHCGGGYCCSSGVCCGADAAPCDDGNTCTDDACSAAHTCVHAPNQTPCGAASCAGLTWSAPKLCAAGTCGSGGAATSCQGSNPCKSYGCALDGCTEDNVASGVTCQAPVCEGYELTAAAACDGLGGCTVGGGTEPCPNGYACLTATSCRTQCQGDEHCAPGTYCKANKCTSLHEDGQKCAADSQCASGHCGNGICCGGGGCCASTADCGDGNSCTTETCVDFQCASAPNSELCASPSCDGLTYASARVCEGGACQTAATESCGGSVPCKIYGCDPATGCTVDDAAAGTPCGSGSCSGYMLSTGSVCDGSGSCGAGPSSGPCPGGFVCADGASCRSACDQDSHCRPGFYCQATVCLPMRTNGESCTAGQQCASGHCANGFCCASGKCCGGNDAQCNDGNSCTDDLCGPAFQCVSSPNAAVCTPASCQGSEHTAASTCSGGLCAGGGGVTDCQGTNPCKVYGCSSSGCTASNASFGQLCLPPVCTGNTITASKTCDGQGTCALGGAPEPCSGGYACFDASSCRKQCSQDAHCAPGHYCAGAKCTPQHQDGESCSTDQECESAHCGGGTCCSGAECCTKDEDCDDGDPCSDDLCVAFACTHEPNAAPCVEPTCDGQVYVPSSTCQDGTCMPPAATADCSAAASGADPCLIYGCDASFGCTVDAAPAGLLCSVGVCSGSILVVPPGQCDGAGQCVEPSASVECPGGYACKDASSCRTSCADDAQCAEGFICTNGACEPRRDDGAACDAASQCASDHCAGGVCCSGGDCCVADEVCDDGNPCTDDTCVSFACDHQPNAAPCGVPACDGNLRRGTATCSGGACQEGPVVEDCSGSDPCLVYGCVADTCTVELAGADKPCGDGFCAGSTLTSGLVCDVAGSCVPGDGTGPCPGGFACANGTSCRTSCVDTSHCRADFYCKSGVCLPKSDNGETCTSSAQCGSGHCANGFCCASGKCCGGNDAQCAAAKCGPDGFTAPETCSVAFECVTPSPVACAGDNPCMQYGCVPSFGCTEVPTVGASCGVPVCAGSVLTPGSTCDEQGECLPDGASAPCPGLLRCDDDTVCLQWCTDHAHCVDGTYCDAGTCVPKQSTGHCESDVECASGYCANGACCVDDGTSPVCCVSSDDCAPPLCAGLTYTSGATCDQDNRCQPGETFDCSGTEPCLEYGCNPATGCTQVPSTPDKECGDTMCLPPASFVAAPTCDGAGSCGTGGMASWLCPGGFACADFTVCATTCSPEGGCRPGFHCSAQTCQPDQANGSTC